MTHYSSNRSLFTPATIAVPVLLAISACSQSPTQPALQPDAPSTMLLVTRNDGSIIRQTIDYDADVCLKIVTSPTTTCLTQGEPIVNNQGTVVGYEMRPRTVELEGIN